MLCFDQWMCRSLYMSSSFFVALWRGECVSAFQLGLSLIALSGYLAGPAAHSKGLSTPIILQTTPLYSEDVYQHTKHGYNRYHAFLALPLWTAASSFGYSTLAQLPTAFSAFSPQCSTVRSAISPHRPNVSPATSPQYTTAFSASVILEVSETGSGYPDLQIAFPATIDNTIPARR